MFGFNKKKEEPKKEETKVKQETQSNNQERKVGDEWIGEFSKTKVKLLKEGESIFIPIGSKHRLENPGKASVILIEVQTGTYLGEDDIIRYEDLYSRK